MDWGWMLPEPVSTFGGEIDALYYMILAITGAIFVIVEVALIVFIIRYRRREGRKAAYSHGNKVAEMVWTVIPFVLVLYIAYQSNDVWLETKVAERALENESAIPIRVSGKQFEWNITYSGPDEELDTGDDFVVRNQLHVPVGRSVRIELTSEDVIHSFFLPELRVKQDAVPGMLIPVWFQATEAGQYTLACAELCGLGHYRMRASMTVHELDDYDRWMAEASGEGEEPGPQIAPPDTAKVEIEAAHDGQHRQQSGEGDDRA